MKNMSTERGQGLIEAVLAVAVVMLVTYALLNMGVLGLRNAGLSNDRVRATRYMQEGFELLRAQRDSGVWNDIESLPVDTPLCFDPSDNSVVTIGCYEAGEIFKTAYLLSNRFERTFVMEEVSREDTTSCPAGCSACGALDSTGTVDSCTRKITMQVAWRGVGPQCEDHPILGLTGNRYCVSSESFLTNWR